MKQVFFILLSVIILASCNSKEKELSKENGILINEIAAKDSMLNDFINSMVIINDNIEKIKEKEQIIAVNAQDANGDNKKSKADKINSDIQAIYDLMVINKERILKLEKQLNTLGNKNSKFKKLISSLNKQLKEKGIEIIQLREQLASKDFKIKELNFTIEGMSHALDSIRNLNKTAMEALSEADKKINAVYYAFGTKKELKEHGLFSRAGLFSKKKILDDEFDKEYFKTGDKRDIDEIELFSSRVKVLTQHPSGSYKIEEDSEKNKVLKIIDKDAFWSVSNYLVIQTNN